MKILDEWKVYAGTSDLKQTKEGILVSEVIINANYSDDHDDYDIALMKLSQPLVLSGEVLECLLSTSAQPVFLLFKEGLICLSLFSSSGSPSLPSHVRPKVSSWEGLLHHRLWQNQ